MYIVQVMEVKFLWLLAMMAIDYPQVQQLHEYQVLGRNGERNVPFIYAYVLPGCTRWVTEKQDAQLDGSLS